MLIAGFTADTFKGTIVFFCKTLKSISNELAYEQCAKAGYNVESAFTKRTSILVCDAKTLPWGEPETIGVRIVTERQWRVLVGLPCLPGDETTPTQRYCQAVNYDCGRGVKRDLKKAIMLYDDLLERAKNEESSDAIEIRYDPVLFQYIQLAQRHVERLKAILEGNNPLPTTGARWPNLPCGFVFKVDDELYKCPACGVDETRCFCIVCFHSTDHDNHNATLKYLTYDGAFCDCGDAHSWRVPMPCTMHPTRTREK